MGSNVLFTSVEYDKYDYSVSLPSKFSRLLDKMDMGKHLEGKNTVIKMHLGRSIGYSTIHPLFVKMLNTLQYIPSLLLLQQIDH